VSFTLAGTEVSEDFGQRFSLHFRDGARRQPEAALAVFIEHSVLQKLFEQVGLLLVFRVLRHLLDGLEGLLAVLQDELHQLVKAEELVLRGEFVAVELAVEVLHVGGIVDRTTEPGTRAGFPRFPGSAV
jgi:hypothetical protein